MKTSTLRKSIVALTLMVIMGMGAYAQVITDLPTLKSLPTDSTMAADTVSVGAFMPYMVVPDPTISSSALYNASGFAWTISGGTLTQSDGTTALAVSPVAASGYYTDQTVYATMPGTAQNITMTVTERSNPKFSATSGCDGNTRTLAIDVIALPSVPSIADADTAQGTCSTPTSSTTYSVKFDYSGITTKFPVYVSYVVKAYNLSGTLMGSQTYYYQINSGSETMSIPQTQLDAAYGSSNMTGRYTVTLNTAWDRISANAMNRASLGVDLSTSSLYAAIVILTAPNTGVIKHIKTL